MVWSELQSLHWSVWFQKQVPLQSSALAQNQPGGTFGYAANRFRIEGRNKPPRQGYYSTGRRKHNPSGGRQCKFPEGRSSAKETTPSDCRRAQAIIYADEKEMGEKKEEYSRAKVVAVSNHTMSS
jgi:hypothetical protein